MGEIGVRMVCQWRYARADSAVGQPWLWLLDLPAVGIGPDRALRRPDRALALALRRPDRAHNSCWCGDFVGSWRRGDFVGSWR